VVVAEWDQGSSGLEGEKIILSGADLDRYRQLGLPQLLQQAAGVQIESAGSGGGRSIVRIHGGRSNQVLVLLDGQRLNNPQTGEVDLSEIPLEQIESIEVIRQGNSALYGGSAFDGVIEFHTRRTPQVSNYSLQSRASSFSSYMGSVSAGLTVLDIGGLFNYQQDYSQQNFDYKYEGETFTRENAWYRSRKFFGKVNYETGRYGLNVLYNRREGNRALPCSFFNECGDVDARMDETVQAWQSNQRWILSSHSYLEGLIAYHRLYQLYNNENDPVRITRYKTEQTNQTFEAQLSGRFSAANFTDVRLGLNYMKETMNQENLLNPQTSIGEKSRESRAGFAGAEVKLPALRLIWR
jgi:outer membrane cobalamin receptor